MSPHGFVAVELLLVVATAVTGISAAAVALHPTQELAERRDLQRTTDVAAIAAALSASEIPAALPAEQAMLIGTATAGCSMGCSAITTSHSCLNLTTVMPQGVPKDPLGGTDEKTDYYALRNGDGTVTVGACDPESNAAISATH